MISDMSQNSMPRIADVAKQAGVVVATVSDVLNRPERVSRATRLRVEAAIIELGYIPSSSARQLRGVRSKLIGMLATDLDDEFQLKVAQHGEAAASAAGRRILHCQTLGAVERELACLESFHEMGAEGVVLVSVGDVTAQLLRMEEAGIYYGWRRRASSALSSTRRQQRRSPQLALSTKPGATLPGTTWSTRVVAALPSSVQAWEARKLSGGWLGLH